MTRPHPLHTRRHFLFHEVHEFHEPRAVLHMNRFKLATTISSFALLGALAFATVPASADAAPAAPVSAAGYPTRYTESGVPEYGLVGQGIWQVAGIVNVGEPSVRIVYDQTVPGAHDRAMSAYYQMTSQLYQLQQP